MRVLLVEDYMPIQKAVARGLRESGFAVDVTGDGEEALWHAMGADYAVIILDLMLPKMDGLTILERLRSDGRAAHVLILTGRDSVTDRVRGLDLGADDYLVKPFAFEELLARVRALARRFIPHGHGSTLRPGACPRPTGRGGIGRDSRRRCRQWDIYHPHPPASFSRRLTVMRHRVNIAGTLPSGNVILRLL